jgi:hypothetical protein
MELFFLLYWILSLPIPKSPSGGPIFTRQANRPSLQLNITRKNLVSFYYMSSKNM